MPEIEFDARMKPLWLRLQLVATAMLVTEIIYLVVCLVIAYHLEDGEFRGFIVRGGDPGILGLLRIILLVLSFPFALGAFWMRSFAKRRKVTVTPTPGWDFPGTPEGEALARLTQAVMVSMAMAETPGIFGLVTFFMRGGFAWLGVFFAIAFLSKLLLMPQRSELRDMLDAGGKP